MEDISLDELKLLAHLHEHAKGYGSTFGLAAAEVGDALGTTEEQLQKDASFLRELGFVGTEGYQAYAFANEGRLLEIYLTGPGEKFCRALDRALADDLAKTPSKAKKITARVVEVVYEIGKPVIVKVLSDWVTGHH